MRVDLALAASVKIHEARPASGRADSVVLEGRLRSVVTVELTIEEAQAISDLFWGNPIDTRWLCSASNKVRAALDGQKARAA